MPPTERSPESGFSFRQLLEAVAAEIPERPAIVWRDDVRTYGELVGRARNIAGFLRGQGLGLVRERAGLRRWESGQDHVAVIMRNRPEWLETMLAAAFGRMATVNVNYHYGLRELRQVIELARPKAVLYERRFAEQVAALAEALGPDSVLIEVADDSDTKSLSGAHPYEEIVATPGAHDASVPVETSPDDLYVLCTGGTTGMPKAVLWRQADLYVAALGGRDPKTGREFAGLDEIVRRIPPAGRPVLPAAPLMHGAAQWYSLTALFAGDTVVLQNNNDRLDPHEIWQTIERRHVSMLCLTGNAAAKPLIDDLAGECGHDLSSLRFVISGAAALSAELKNRLLELLPQLTVVESVGASESGTALLDRSSLGAPTVVGVFRASPGAGVLRDDRTAMLTAGDPEAGWLARAGHVPLGYLDDADRTLETFPEIDGVRYAIPGDRAKVRPDGRVELLGRDSTVINTGGEKVFTEEVEAVLLRHPAVYDVVVTSRPSARWGQEVVAVVQLTPGGNVTIEALQEWAASDLARYKAPKDVVFVDTVRRTPAGKPDVAWARAIAAAEHETP